MLTADTEEVALHFENTDINSNTNLVQTHRIRHPIALLCHMLFRSLAIITFLFASAFSNSFITVFVIIISFLSIDFWTVKNITGRLLVGLRWWNQVDEDGKSHWIFENRKVNMQSSNIMAVVESTTEVTVFWGSLVIFDLVWAVFFLISLLSFNFKWMTIIVVALMLNASNTYGFLKCKYGSEQNMQSVATSFFGKQIFSSMMNKMSTFGGSNNQNTASPGGGVGGSGLGPN